MNISTRASSIRRAALAVVICLVAGACGTQTSVETSWTSPQARVATMHRVVTLFISRDGALRRSSEDRMARELAARGVQATPAYQILPSAGARDLASAKATLRALGFDGVVAMRIVDREHKLEYVPGDFDAYWGDGWGYPYAYGGFPGYAYTETIVRVETSAYSLTTNQLVWSALSRTTDPRNASSLIHSVARLAATQLVRRGIA